MPLLRWIQSLPQQVNHEVIHEDCFLYIFLNSYFHRIMEAVASGLLLEDGPGLKDPCERADVDACDHLTSQMRADVTRQAQTDIRNIHFRKIHLVLGMDKVDRFEKKFKKEATPASAEVKVEETENQE